MTAAFADVDATITRIAGSLGLAIASEQHALEADSGMSPRLARHLLVLAINRVGLTLERPVEKELPCFTRLD